MNTPAHSVARSTSSTTLPLRPDLLQGLEQIGFTDMTAIQRRALPLLLQGRDLIAHVQGGRIKKRRYRVRLV